MEPEKPQSFASGMAYAAAEIAKTVLPYALGLALIIAASRWDGRISGDKGCFELQEIKGIVYKVNTCSGQIEVLESKSVQPSPHPARTSNNSFKPTPLRGAASFRR